MQILKDFISSHLKVRGIQPHSKTNDFMFGTFTFRAQSRRRVVLFTTNSTQCKQEQASKQLSNLLLHKRMCLVVSSVIIAIEQRKLCCNTGQFLKKVDGLNLVNHDKETELVEPRKRKLIIPQIVLL